MSKLRRRRSRNRDPFGRVEAARGNSPPNWKPGSHSSQFDYALITLKEAVGERTFKKWNNKRLCYWGSAAAGADTSLDAVPSALVKKLIGARVATAGYPGDRKRRDVLRCRPALRRCASRSPDQGGTSVEEWVKRTSRFSSPPMRRKARVALRCGSWTAENGT